MPVAPQIVLGGYFALQHHVEPYRMTHDVDAWWLQSSSDQALSQIRLGMEHIAEKKGLVMSEKSWGETSSFDLNKAGKKIFSFQISEREKQLEPYLLSPWNPLKIETLSDNVASKMTALVQRGAPRDFRDIYELVNRDVLTIEKAWNLYSLKNPNKQVNQAKELVMINLNRIESRRPLNTLTEQDQHAAMELRQWFKSQFLHKEVNHGFRP